MERLPFLLLLLLCVGLAGSSAVDLHKRIYGGQVCQPGESPYHVKLTYDPLGEDPKSLICGGSLITNQWILTAAHCQEPTMQAVLGLNPDPNSNLQPTEEIQVQPFPHPSGDDIMLLKLPKPYNYPTIALPDAQGCQRPALNQTVKVSGHGWFHRNKSNKKIHPPSTQLQCVEMDVVDCLFAPDETTYLNMTIKPIFCGSRRDKQGNVKDVGPGDSGGGVVYNNKLHGIVRACNPGVLGPAGPAKVVDVCPYITWINGEILRN